MIRVYIRSTTLKSELAILVFKADQTNLAWLPANCHLAEIPRQL